MSDKTDSVSCSIYKHDAHLSHGNLFVGLSKESKPPFS